MKTLLRRLLIYIFILFVLPKIVPGFSLQGGIWTFIIAAFILTLLMLVVKPILSIVTFPINLITLGLFSLFVNAIILYLLVIFVSSISLVPFTYQSMQIFNLMVPGISFNIFFAYIYTAFVITFIDSLIRWLLK